MSAYVNDVESDGFPWPLVGWIPTSTDVEKLAAGWAIYRKGLTHYVIDCSASLDSPYLIEADSP